ncbi:MAG: hypothetical protein MUE40_01120 [Anaerolineae bacterium]|jgi:hypothetical protein|nr:hypothetical protein [Anaerolineae bacterium]
MARVINTNSPQKRRNHLMRTIAEILRGLGQKHSIDDEARDMAATIVFCLRDIDDTINESIQAWEKRNYYKKADDFQEKWWWAAQYALRVEKLVREAKWEDLPAVMMKLFPYFAEIEINKPMRDEKDWLGGYDKLMAEPPRA